MYLWYALRSELHLAKVRRHASKVKTALHGIRGVKVNIAPGTRPFTDWINLDVFSGSGITHAYDCRKDLPFDDGSVSAIYSEHFVEHLEYSEEAQRFAAECARVLSPGGRLRIVVPHAARFLEAYVSGERSTLTDLIADEPWFDGRWNTPMELVNLIFRQAIEHHFAYDAETLALLCTNNGLSEARERAFNDSDIPDFPGDTAARRKYSLYVEAGRSPQPT